MNYSNPMIYDFPYSNPVTKIACGVGLLWLGYVAIKSSKALDEVEPTPRKNRKGVMDGKIDRDIDKKNQVLGGPVPSNPSVPFYSRHNYNRRRKR